MKGLQKITKKLKENRKALVITTTLILFIIIGFKILDHPRFNVKNEAGHIKRIERDISWRCLFLEKAPDPEECSYLFQNPELPDYMKKDMKYADDNYIDHIFYTIKEDYYIELERDPQEEKWYLVILLKHPDPENIFSSISLRLADFSIKKEADNVLMFYGFRREYLYSSNNSGDFCSLKYDLNEPMAYYNAILTIEE